MPLPGARYRVKQTSKGPIRLAFKDGKVEEAKNLKTGATHTPAEFKADARKAAMRRMVNRRGSSSVGGGAIG